MVPKMWNQGSNFVTGSKYGTLEPVLGTGSAISGFFPQIPLPLFSSLVYIFHGERDLSSLPCLGGAAVQISLKRSVVLLLRSLEE